MPISSCINLHINFSDGAEAHISATSKDVDNELKGFVLLHLQFTVHVSVINAQILGLICIGC